MFTVSVKKMSLSVFGCLVLISTSSFGQGMVLLGDNEYAQNCYRAAEIAALNQMADDDAIEQCTLAIDIASLKPKDRIATLVNRGILYAAQENYARAKQDYERASRLKGHSGEVYANLGNVYFLLREYDVAVKHYNSAIERGMQRVHIAYLNRGMVFENTGNLEAAERDYLQAQALAPEWLKPKELLQRVQIKQAKQVR